MHTIGILALQGAFLEHGQMLEGLGVEHFEIRQLDDLNRPMDGLILPGGESTAMGKLMDCLDMLQRSENASPEDFRYSAPVPA